MLEIEKRYQNNSTQSNLKHERIRIEQWVSHFTILNLVAQTQSSHK